MSTIVTNSVKSRVQSPSIEQMHVVDHVAQAPADGQSRNVMQEAARIARGNIRDLAEVKADELDALVMPGGFGAAKNLSNFAVVGADAEVRPELAERERARASSAASSTKRLSSASFQGLEMYL